MRNTLNFCNATPMFRCPVGLGYNVDHHQGQRQIQLWQSIGTMPKPIVAGYIKKPESIIVCPAKPSGKTQFRCQIPSH